MRGQMSGTTKDDASGPEDPRVRFAGERTLLAWIRTGLALMGFGFVVARFGLFLRELGQVADPQHTQPARTGLSLGLGTVLVVVGVVVLVLSALEHFWFLRQLERGEPIRAPRWSLAVTLAVILAILGMVTAIALFVW
jgi:putative membrane protein